MEKCKVYTIDELGRVVLPLELRKDMNLNEGDTVTIHQLDTNTIILQRTTSTTQDKQ